MLAGRPHADRRQALGLVALLVLHAAWGLLYVARTSVEVDGARWFVLWDDAMISMRYAQNLAAGDGLVWNAGGERVQGITNLGVTLVMAAVHRLPVGPQRIALVVQLICLAALSALLVLAYGAARDLYGRARGAPLWAAALVALCGPLAVWTLQGSDVGFVSLWLLAAFAWVARAQARGRGWPSGVLPFLSLGVLLRPDVTLFVVVFALAAWRLAADRRRVVGLGALSLAGVWLGLLALGWLYYGDPLPNTWYLKGTGHPRGLVLLRGLTDLAPLFTWYAAVIVAQWGIGVHALLRGDRVSLLGAALLAAALLYSIWVGGDWLPTHVSRYVVPVLPLYLILLVGVCLRFVDRVARGETRIPARAARGLGVALLLVGSLGVNPVAPLREWLDPRAPTLLRLENQINLGTALYFRDHTAPETTIAVHWAGVPIYYSGRPGVDVLGKSDRHIAKLEVQRFHPGHSKWDWDYVVGELRPDVFRQTTRGLLQHAGFRRDYLLARRGEERSFYVRRDATHLLRDETLALRPLDPPSP